MPHRIILSSCILFLVALCCSCGTPLDKVLPFSAEEVEQTVDTRKSAEELLAEAPGGAIPKPSIPTDLRQYAEEKKRTAIVPEVKALDYVVQVESPDDSALVGLFQQVSLMISLREKNPTNFTGLRQRLRSDMEEANNILKSQGYYGGSVSSRFDFPQLRQKTEDGGREPLKVIVTFKSGRRYLVGKTSITAEYKEGRASPNVQEDLPKTLADVGLPSGDPAYTSSVLAAVGKIQDAFRNNGYPFATLGTTRYIVDHEKKTLDADIHVFPGPYTLMGDVHVAEGSPVKERYVKARRTWLVGQAWDQRLVDSFHESLRGTGIYQSITLEPSEEANKNGEREVMTALVGAPERTVGGALRYNTDLGPGILAYWEHRNFSGRGDYMRIELPIWADMQVLSASYRMPYIFKGDQDFVANAALVNEDTDAYDMSAGVGFVGLERRFSPHWTGGVGINAEGGKLKDPEEPRREYGYVGLPLSLSFSDVDNILDATSGVRLNVISGPYTGMYDNPFTVVRTTAEGRAFIPMSRSKDLVTALRAKAGFVSGVNASEVPASLRFYTGGGGSVRGYSYQSIGPRNSDDDPLGGASLLEGSAETRWRISESWGVVAFLDGGMVYHEDYPKIDEDWQWGAGLGLRYFTPIGPVRLDMATPLNPRDDDKSVQLYISIGQSF